MGDNLPFADGFFASAFSNSVLEHIPDIQPVLNEVGRVLRPGARFVITTPSHYFTEYLGGAAFFGSLRLRGLAERVPARLQHHLPPRPHRRAGDVGGAAGRGRFCRGGWQYYFSRGALRALELGHAQGLPAAALHALTGHWIVAPWRGGLAPAERWVRPFYEEEAALDGPAPTSCSSPAKCRLGWRCRPCRRRNHFRLRLPDLMGLRQGRGTRKTRSRGLFRTALSASVLCVPLLEEHG